MGSSIAYHLALKDPTLRIIVVEKDSTYKLSSTTLSVASIRQQFSTKENVEMSLYGVNFLRNISSFLSVDGEPCSVDFRERAYLVLSTRDGLPTLKNNHDLQVTCGASVALLDIIGLQQKFAWMNIDGLAGASIGLQNEGWFDAYSLLMAFRRKAKSLGVKYVEDEVNMLKVASQGQKRTVEVVGLRDGQTLAPKIGVVNAAGAWAADIAQMAGIDLPVEPRSRSVFSFHCKDETFGSSCPLVVDPSGVYFRPEGRGFITGHTPDPDPPGFNWAVDYESFYNVIWPVLASRVPAFEAIKQTGAWVGHYEYNTFDQNAILGAHPVVTNFYFANGFSGHGIQQSIAVGRGVSEYVLAGRFETLNLSKFCFTRILENKPVLEKNVF